MSKPNRSWLWRAVVAALPPLVVAALAIWAYWLRSGPEPANVIVREGGVEVARTTRTEALTALEERVGFRPVMPERLPIKGLSLARVDSLLPPEEGVNEPTAAMMLVQRDRPQPEMVFAVQSTEFKDGAQVGVPDDARAVDLGIEGAQAWDIGEGLVRYLVRADGMYVWVFLLSLNPLTDGDVLPMLRSIADQLLSR